MKKWMIIDGLLTDENGKHYHNYKEESICIERERESCPTIKARYFDGGFWIIEHEEVSTE